MSATIFTAPATADAIELNDNGGFHPATFARMAPDMVRHGWSVFPQTVSPRAPALSHGRQIRPVTEAHVDAVLTPPELLEEWRLQCATANVACVFGAAMPGVFALDIDITDAEICNRVVALAEEHLGATSFRRVGAAPKIALFYRTAGDDLVSSSVTRIAEADESDTGHAIEIQSTGKTMTLDGIHHRTGRTYRWGDIYSSHPSLNHVSELPEVASEQVSAFLEAVAEAFPIVKASRYSEAQWAEGDAGRVRSARLIRKPGSVPARDGREEILRDLVWRTTRANGRALTSAVEGEDYNGLIRDIATAVAEAFGEAAVCDGRWAPGALRVAAGKAVAALARKIRSGDVRPPRSQGIAYGENGEPVALPVVQLRVGDIAEAVDASEGALVASRRGVYQRGGALVQIGEVPVHTAAGSWSSAQRIFGVSEPALLEHLSVAARYERYDGKAEEWKQVTPPAWIASTLASRSGRLRLPVLSGVIGAPTLRADGSILDQPGYDDATGLYLDLQGTAFPQVPASPTREQAAFALGKLQSLISTFPFVGPQHASVALACMLTAVVRRSLSAAPGFGYSAPTAGSGKSKLVDMASVLASGREAGVITQASKEEETEKRISSLLIDGSSLLALDNCDRPVDSSLLCQVLTQPTIRPRVLGKSEAPEVPSSMLVTLTGNNLVLVGDLTRRILPARLDAAVERPELRQFATDPVEECKSRRGELVVAALTVLRAYRVAGSPAQAAPLGSFGAWSRTVRDAILWLGCADPVATLDEAREKDPRLAALEGVVGQWAQAFGSRRVSGRELISAAVELSPAIREGQRPEFLRPDFREALLAIAEAGGAINSRRLSQWLSGQVGRIVGGSKIVRDGVAHGGVQLWRLQLSAEAEAEWHARNEGPAQIHGAASRGFPTEDDAASWLRTPLQELDNLSPMVASQSADGLGHALELLHAQTASDLQHTAEHRLGSPEAASEWLWTANAALQDRTPLDEIRVGQGAARVHRLLEGMPQAKVVRLTR